VEVLGTADVRVVDGRPVLSWLLMTFGFVFDDRSDALVGECADIDGMGGDLFDTLFIKTAIEPQYAKACAKALLGVRPVGQDCDDQAFGLGAEASGPSFEARWRPVGITPVRTRHVIGMGAVAAAVIAALMTGDAAAFMENLDGLAGQPDVDLGTDQSMGHGIEEFLGLDMIVGTDPGKLPDRELIGIGGQGLQCWPLDRVEEVLTTDIEPAHRPAVEIVESVPDGGIAFGKREEGLMTQPTENIGLGQAHTGLDLRFVLRTIRPGWKDADAIVGRHLAVTAIDLGIIEGGFFDAALEVVGNQEPRSTLIEAEHPNMACDPIRQLLRLGDFSVGVVAGAQHADEDLGLADLAGLGISDRHLVAGNMLLTHDR